MAIYTEISHNKNGDFPVRYVSLPEGKPLYITRGHTIFIKSRYQGGDEGHASKGLLQAKLLLHYVGLLKQDVLVGGWGKTPLKSMKINWDDEIPNIWKNKKCSKPSTSVKVDFHELDVGEPVPRLSLKTLAEDL